MRTDLCPVTFEVPLFAPLLCGGAANWRACAVFNTAAVWAPEHVAATAIANHACRIVKIILNIVVADTVAVADQLHAQTEHLIDQLHFLRRQGAVRFSDCTFILFKL